MGILSAAAAIGVVLMMVCQTAAQYIKLNVVSPPIVKSIFEDGCKLHLPQLRPEY